MAESGDLQVVQAVIDSNLLDVYSQTPCPNYDMSQFVQLYVTSFFYNVSMNLSHGFIFIVNDVNSRITLTWNSLFNLQLSLGNVLPAVTIVNETINIQGLPSGNVN